MSQTDHLKVTILGSGTSQGVPVIGCKCKVCLSMDSRDKRLRSSILVSKGEMNIVVDTGPDFRQQMLKHNVDTLEAILFTHEHKDHVAGLDDVRAYNYIQKKDMDVFCTEEVEAALKREFYYAFQENKYPGVPNLNIRCISKENKFKVKDLSIQPIEVMHYKMPVLGFKIGNFTYITDAKTVSESEKNKIKGTDILIVNALREQHHISHFNLEEALTFIEEINPRVAYLTHISHLFERHVEIEKKLPSNVFVAYDGLTLEFKE